MNTIELLRRNLQDVFGEADPDRRSAAIADIYTDDAVVYLPDAAVTGHENINTVAGEIRAGHPTFVYTDRGTAQVVQNGGVLAWGSGPKGQPAEYTGLDFIETRDGKIAALYVFLNPDLG